MVGGSFRIAVSAFIFVLTGLVQTVCIQSVLYSGGGDRSTFLLAIPNYLGIVFVHFFGARVFKLLDHFGVWVGGGADVNRVHTATYEPRKDSNLGFWATLFHKERRKLFVFAFNEMGGFLSGLTGLSIAGSGLYQVVFSGATVFTALLTTAFLRKRLSLAQWLFIGVITAGLMITAEQVTHASTEAGAASLVSGVSFVLVSCLFYSTNYVIAEHFLVKDHAEGEEEVGVLPPPTGLDLSLYTGGTCLVLFGVYVLAYTVPNWKELVVASIERHHGNTTLIVEEYFYMTVASFFHAVTHYDVVATTGAVPIGVLNAIRAVSVFAISSWLFCTHQASQCYNSRKGASTAIVVVGAFGYSAATAAISSARMRRYTRLKSGEKMETVDRLSTKRLRRSMSSGVEMARSMSALPFLDLPDRVLERSTGSWFGFSKKRRDEKATGDG